MCIIYIACVRVFICIYKKTGDINMHTGGEGERMKKMTIIKNQLKNEPFCDTPRLSVILTECCPLLTWPPAGRLLSAGMRHSHDSLREKERECDT